MRLAKAGWMGGSPEAIMKARADYVINMLHFEKFESEFSEKYRELNNEDS